MATQDASRRFSAGLRPTFPAGWESGAPSPWPSQPMDRRTLMADISLWRHWRSEVADQGNRKPLHFGHTSPGIVIAFSFASC